VLFDLSSYDNIKLSLKTNFEETITNNEDECALACLQKTYCNHFVYIRSFEPYLNSKKKNCQLSSNSDVNIMPCRYDSICANLSPCKFLVSLSNLILYQIVLVPYLVSNRQLIGDSRELFAIAEDETYQELKLSHFIFEFLHIRHAPII
jgi:hypothetical protein